MAAEGVKNDETRPSDAPSVPSTERVNAGRRLPEDWIDRLLAAPCAVRASAPFEDSAAQILGAARELLDDVAVGVCVPRAALGRSGGLAASGEGGQIVLRFAPTRASH